MKPSNLTKKCALTFERNMARELYVCVAKYLDSEQLVSISLQFSE